MRKKSHTRNAVKNNQENGKTEKKLRKKKEIKELEKLHKLNVVRKFYTKIPEARKGLKQRINMHKAKNGTIFSDQKDVLNC
jgi:hypothetical protein